jgi:hypothetical protein
MFARELDQCVEELDWGLSGFLVARILPRFAGERVDVTLHDVQGRACATALAKNDDDGRLIFIALEKH